MRRLLLWTVLSIALPLALACEPPAPHALSASIVDGTRELGEPAVVVVATFAGLGLCTGTLIAPNVVLTAKHCVQLPGAEEPVPVSTLSVGVGDRADATRTYRVRSVETTPGVYEEDRTFGLRGAIFGVDVAVITLREPVEGVEPIPVRRDRPDDMIGREFTAIGFGLRPDGPSGLKYKGTGVLDSIEESVLFTRQTICSGDSGGPMIQEEPERRVIGVASFGQAGSCPSARDGYNGLYEHGDLIDRALVLAGQCLEREEQCNSLDDDCDGAVDEGCAGLGEACAVDADCALAQLPGFLPPLTAFASCEDLGAGRVCTRSCDVLEPARSCAEVRHFLRDSSTTFEGFYCERTEGCAGRCVPGAVGSLEDGAPCAVDTECASLACAESTDGVRRCAAPCRSGDGTCPVGEACAAGFGACGQCVDASDVGQGPRQLGEPCAHDADCAEGACLSEPAGAYCTRACSSDAECGAAFRCPQGQCVRGARPRVGDACSAPEDCSPGEHCADEGGRRWCSHFCGERRECPDGSVCVASSSGPRSCAPTRALLGEACSADAECADGRCEAGACARACSAVEACGAGFVCRRDEQGRARCRRPPAGGCAVQPGAPSTALGLLALVALALLRRRR